MLALVVTVLLMVRLSVGNMNALLHCYPTLSGRAVKQGTHANDTQPCYQKGGNAIAGHFVAV